jgi:hypothetical protein
MISGLNLNQPVNVAFTRPMLRNHGWNSSFVYDQIIQTICPLEEVDLIRSTETEITPT